VFSDGRRVRLTNETDTIKVGEKMFTERRFGSKVLLNFVDFRRIEFSTIIPSYIFFISVDVIPTGRSFRVTVNFLRNRLFRSTVTDNVPVQLYVLFRFGIVRVVTFTAPNVSSIRRKTYKGPRKFPGEN